MPKYKMLKDWDYAEKGYIVHNYKEGEVYEVDERCAELCDELKCGEKASDKAKTKDEKELEYAKQQAENVGEDQ